MVRTILLVCTTMKLLGLLDQLEFECQRKGLTLDEVCRAAKMKPSTLWRWRRGTVPQEATARKVADVLAGMPSRRPAERQSA